MDTVINIVYTIGYFTWPIIMLVVWLLVGGTKEQKRRVERDRRLEEFNQRMSYLKSLEQDERN